MFEVMGVPPERLADDAWRRAAHDWFVRRTGEHGVRITVAEVDGEVVAAAVGEVTALIPGPGAPNGSVGLVSNVATLPAHRGRGLAAAVTDDLLAWFRRAHRRHPHRPLRDARGRADLRAARVRRALVPRDVRSRSATPRLRRRHAAPLVRDGVPGAVDGRGQSSSSSSLMLAVCCTWARNS